MNDKVIVYISVAGGEVEDLQDLIDGKEVQLTWVGTFMGQEVPIQVRISDEDDLDEEES